MSKKVIQIGKFIRPILEDYQKYNSEFCDDLGCMCAVASYIYWQSLVKLGYEANLVHGAYFGKYNAGSAHCWVDYRNSIYDLTFTQFQAKADKVSVFDKSHRLYKKFRINNTNRLAVKIISKWGEQAPHEHKKFCSETIKLVTQKFPNNIDTCCARAYIAKDLGKVVYYA